MPRFQFSLLTLLVVISLSAAALGTAIWLFPSAATRGRRQADQHWAEQRAVLYVPQDDGYLEFRRGKYKEFGILYPYDRTSGLRMVTMRPGGNQSYYDAYNARVRELLQRFGSPPWSKKTRIPTDEQLISAFDESCMERIESFPFELAQDLVIDLTPPPPAAPLVPLPSLDADYEPQSHPRQEGEDALRIRWIRSGKPTARGAVKDLYFRRLDEPSGVTLIRQDDMASAYDSDGTCVGCIWRFSWWKRGER